MITENYCSFELSKLLKEKGFKKPCKGLFFLIGYKPQYKVTHQLAMKWLRAQGIRICIDYNNMSGDWYATIAEEYDGQMSERIRSEHFTLYEEAVEAAIRWSLKNLI